MRRVVITGQGTINALGTDVPATLGAMRAGTVGIGALDLPDADRLSIRIGAQVAGYDPEARFDRQQIVLFDRATQFALIAGAEAVADAGLEDLQADRFGVVLGSAAAGLQTWEDSYRAVFQDGRNRVHPFTVPKLMLSAPASHLAMTHGARGPAFMVSSACASSNHAMGQALSLIRCGAADVMLTGGTEAMLSFGGVKAWEGLRVLSPDACRPFSSGRNGMVLGEGAGIFVFEALDHALARGARPLAEVAGFSMTSDAADIVAPSADGAARAMRGALTDAGLAPAEIGYINAHGTGTALNDKTECAAITMALGAQDIPVSSTKSMHGHLIGATGAVELLSCIMALRDQVIAPTMGFLGPDPACSANVVAQSAQVAPVEATLSNAFAFGGLNAVIALRHA